MYSINKALYFIMLFDIGKLNLRKYEVQNY